MLEALTSFSTLIGSLALVTSVVVLLRELRETNRLTRAANAQALVEIASPFYLALVQDRSLGELCLRGVRDFDALDEVDRHRHHHLLLWWLIFYENVYYQRRQGLLDRHAFQPWWRDLKAFIIEQNLAQHWERLKPLLQVEFAEQVGHLIAEVATPKG